MTYPINAILSITRERLTYVDDSGMEHTIDLKECGKNWVAHVNKGGYITWNGEPVPKITEEENTCVGARDWFHERPYYLFYANPCVRFELHIRRRWTDRFNKHWRQRYYSAFRKVNKELESAGWSTFDMG